MTPTGAGKILRPKLASTKQGSRQMLHWRITSLVITGLVVLGAFLGELDGFIWS